MKFAIYGVPRSGKNYFINNLQQYFLRNGEQLHHLNGSETLNNFALDKYGVKFKQCTEKQKSKLRKLFILYVNSEEKSHKYIVVDGHYAFYDNENTLYTVCDKFDINCYDKFFYIEENPNEIVERMKISVGDKKNNNITRGQIKCWQDYEIDNLTVDLLSVEKELHVIKNDGEFASKYVFDCVTKNKYDSFAIAKDLVKTLNLDSSYAVLVDCDKTLSFEDSATLAIDYKGKSETTLKEIFKNDRYSNFQLRQSFDYTITIGLYTEDAMNYVINTITPNQKLIDDLLSLNSIPIIGITAGKGEVWNKIVQKFKLQIQILAHKHMIVSKYVKYFVVKELQKRGKYVIAIGDSLLDGLMLQQANKGYIVTAKGYRKNVDIFLSTNKSMLQLDYFPLCYQNSPHEKGISLLKTLYPDNNIKKAISICKSNSEISGKQLRNAHYDLGKQVAQMIQLDFASDSFTVVAILRSGLPFSLGIADHFDCPIVFCDDKNITDFEKILQENPQLDNSTFIICDAVVNSGKTINSIAKILSGKKCIIATNVLSDKYKCKDIPIYAARVSKHSYIGAKQKKISNGKGPDTADRLYKLL